MENLQDVVAARAAGRNGTARTTREKAGLTLRELAGHLQIHSSSLSDYERGKSRPGPEIAARWMQALRLMDESTNFAAALKNGRQAPSLSGGEVIPPV